MRPMSKDTIFQTEAAARVSFRFDDSVARVFPDMINRSVPGYAASLDGIALIAHQSIRPGGRAYDLGCTLGAATLAMAQGIGERAANLVGIDLSDAMINRCKADQRFDTLAQRVEFHTADITGFDYQPADLVVLNYTLQFLHPEQRAPLLDNLYQCLNPGGVLVLAEKFHFEAPGIADRLTRLHFDFKRAHHYSDLEIAGKRSALENVLITDTRETHIQRLESVGFEDVVLWHSAINFGAFLACKPDA